MNEKINKILEFATNEDASDIFLNENEQAWLKIKGEVVKLKYQPVSKAEILDLASNINYDIEKLQDIDASLIFGNFRFRINFFKNFGGLGLVLRPIKSSVKSMYELGLPNELLESWFSQKNGLILVTGSTGSGKSTTLASGIEWINTNLKRHIVTIEDPIEFIFENKESLIHQRQIGNDTKDFKTGLRSSLRQSPDIIFVGEIRDLETANIALQASETGHLVLSTLHSEDIIETIERLTNIFPNEQKDSLLSMLAKQLIGIISQKLIPAKSGDYFLAMEHMQNEGATRNWIKESNYSELTDFINRKDNKKNLSFLNYIVSATKSGVLDKEVALTYCNNEIEFLRSLKGIS